MISATADKLPAHTMEQIGSGYRLIKEISHGPTASIYQASLPGQDQPVAIKLFNPLFHKEARFAIRFREHLRRLTTLSHDNLAAVLDYGIDGERYYIVMDWVEGIDLGSYISEYAPLPPDLSVFIARQVCASLDAIHRHGLIHQGIKPRNILLTAQGQVKLTDIGLSGLLSESGLSKTHVMQAGVGYIPPEQARGQKLAAQSDIYSLGAILFEMLTGRLPFESKDAWSMVRMHARETPPSPRQLNQQVPEELAKIVTHALHKDTALRFASASEMDDALAGFEKDYAAVSLEGGHSDPQPSALDFISLLRGLFEPGMAKSLLFGPWQIAGRTLPFGVVVALLVVLTFLIAFALVYAAVLLIG